MSTVCISGITDVKWGQPIKLIKVRIFWEGHEIWKNLPLKIFGPNFSYLIFEAANFLDFWGPAVMRGNDF